MQLLEFDWPPVPTAEVRERRRRALAEAASSDLDGLLIWAKCGTPGTSADIQYFANHFSPFPWVPPEPPALTACEHAALLLRPPDGEALITTGYVSPTVDIADVRNGLDLAAAVCTALGDYELMDARLGVIGSELLPYSVTLAIRTSAPQLTLVIADEISYRLREHLSEWELGALRAAGRVGQFLASAMVDGAIPGRSEGEVVGETLALAARIPACMPESFLVSSGDMAASFVAGDVPPWRPEYVYQAGDVMHFDCYGYLHGYPYDLARTTVLSRPSPAQQRVIEGARGLCAALAETLRPGVTPRRIYETGLAYLAEQGLDAGQIPGFGHGLACGFIPPYFVPLRTWSRELDRELAPPIALAFETFVTDGRGNYAGWEEDYLWLPDGTVEMTTG